MYSYIDALTPPPTSGGAFHLDMPSPPFFVIMRLSRTWKWGKVDLPAHTKHIQRFYRRRFSASSGLGAKAVRLVSRIIMR